jgi:hypothetical protein
MRGHLRDGAVRVRLDLHNNQDTTISRDRRQL